MKVLRACFPALLLTTTACAEGAEAEETHDPRTAERVSIDRFSEEAGTLMVRDGDNLPGPDEPIDFDRAPFITKGLGPDGDPVEYYNFDVQPTDPAPIYVLFREGEDAPVEGQLNIVDVVPGDTDYNDFWNVVRVTVPDDYVANTYASVDALERADLEQEATDVLVNCPIVPDGSTASRRGGSSESTDLIQGWYDERVVTYFSFEEAPLTSTGTVPVSPIYVAFNINPDLDGGGPPSGFVTESDDEQTHNVIATVPGDDRYSPLWLVNVYDNAEFDDVEDLDTAVEATRLAEGVATVNCPVVS